MIPWSNILEVDDEDIDHKVSFFKIFTARTSINVHHREYLDLHVRLFHD